MISAADPTASSSKVKGTKGLKRKASSKASSSTSSKKSRKPPLGKLLASSDVATRETAVEDLLEFLAGQGAEADSDAEHGRNGNEGTAAAEPEWDSVKLPKAFREENMLLLWQGCFYCMYMCDKPLPQQKLANQLSQPLLTILENPKLKSKTARLQAALSYLSVFWLTMARQWSGIDKHRTDKYYSLMRRMLHMTFRLLRESGWNENAMKEVNTILTRPSGPIHLQDTRTPISMAYHIIDIYVEELERSLEDETEVEGPVPVPALLQPFINVLAETTNKAAYQRVLENVFDPLLDEASTAEESQEKRTKTDLTELSLAKTLSNQKDGLEREVLKRIFESAAKESSEDIARKRLYAYVGKRGYEGDE